MNDELGPLKFWNNALRGSFSPIHENDPQPGWYRMRDGRSGTFVPVVIMTDSQGAVQALKDGRPVDPSAVWTWCCRNPIPYETYVAVAEHGEPWPDEVPPIGHNSLALDVLAEIADDVALLRQAAQGWLEGLGPIATQADADRAANFADRFAALAQRAETERTADKRPALEEGRAIDQRWKPVIAAAEEAKRQMKEALTPFLLAEAERLSTCPGAEPPRAGTGPRRIGLRTLRRLAVIDEPSLLAAYRADARIWRQADVRTALLKLAEADALAGRDVPGALLVEERVAA
jgi:hypothetical protein